MNTSVNAVNRSTSKPAAYAASYGKSCTRKPKSNNHYVRDRFNNLQWIQNPITNHKVEQLLRAVLYPEELFTKVIGVEGVGLVEANSDILAVHAECAQVITEQQDLDVLCVGIADEAGYRLHPETNSWLIRNGIKPNAFLLALNQVQIEGVPALLADNGKLYTLFTVLYRLAYDALFHTDAFNNAYTVYVRKRGIPKHFTVQNKYFDPSKEYEVI